MDIASRVGQIASSGGQWGRGKAREVRQLRDWRRAGFAPPAPAVVKWSVLERFGAVSGVWVESGTYRGDTTAFLAQRAEHVHTIEPSGELSQLARERFANVHNVTIHHGLSESILPDLLLQGAFTAPVSFWLDGHFSAGLTFKGPVDTPIRAELECIGRALSALSNVTVLVDDVRCFDPAQSQFAEYPSRSWLVDWADTHSMMWTIEQDIFIATKRAAA